jgi:hypothetical protein
METIIIITLLLIIYNDGLVLLGTTKNKHLKVLMLWWSWRVPPPRPIGNKFADYRLRLFGNLA